MIASADGCKGGWIVAVADRWPCRIPPVFAIYRTFQALLDATIDAEVLVVDMPIGLPTGREHRLCDELGRSLLGPEGTTRLFFAPPRPTLVADSPVAFQTLHRAVTGKGAGLPVWGIVKKLREVDAVMTPTLQERVLEFHPELAWRYLAGTTLASKHSAAGIEQRQPLLRPHVACLDEITLPRADLRRNAACLDDLLDALIGLAVAQAVATGPDYSRQMPMEAPERDQRGLRMEMWF